MPEPKKQYDDPLELTTPHVIGQRVKDCQWLLKGNNRFPNLATYKDGAVDGDYGPLTAQAVWRAKYWLGYPPKAIDRSFGQQLYSYLIKSPVTILPAEFQARRSQRLVAAEESIGKKALDTAITQIGTTESPYGSNRQPYGVWYGMNAVPWCAIFCSWCYAHSGYSRFKYSYVPAVHQDASSVRNGLCIVRTPVPGDLICYNWGGSIDAHIEFFEQWLGSPGTTFTAVGGNTGGNFSNGGSVLRQTRYISNVNVFVRITKT